MSSPDFIEKIFGRGKNINRENLLIIFIQPARAGYDTYLSNSARAGYDTRSIFKRSFTGLNSEFSFS